MPAKAVVQTGSIAFKREIVFKAEHTLISSLNQRCGKLATSMPEHCSAEFQWGIKTPTEIRKRNPPPIEEGDICMLVIKNT